jgi:hypothetical protein
MNVRCPTVTIAVMGVVVGLPLTPLRASTQTMPPRPC